MLNCIIIVHKSITRNAKIILIKEFKSRNQFETHDLWLIELKVTHLLKRDEAVNFHIFCTL